MSFWNKRDNPTPTRKKPKASRKPQTLNDALEKVLISKAIADPEWALRQARTKFNLGEDTPINLAEAAKDELKKNMIEQMLSKVKDDPEYLDRFAPAIIAEMFPNAADPSLCGDRDDRDMYPDRGDDLDVTIGTFEKMQRLQELTGGGRGQGGALGGLITPEVLGEIIKTFGPMIVARAQQNQELMRGPVIREVPMSPAPELSTGHPPALQIHPGLPPVVAAPEVPAGPIAPSVIQTYLGTTPRADTPAAPQAAAVVKEVQRVTNTTPPSSGFTMQVNAGDAQADKSIGLAKWYEMMALGVLSQEFAQVLLQAREEGDPQAINFIAELLRHPDAESFVAELAPLKGGDYDVAVQGFEANIVFLNEVLAFIRQIASEENQEIGG